MSKKDFTGKANHKVIYQDTVSATPSEPAVVSVSDGLEAGILISAVPGVTLSATDRIDFVGKKKALAGDSTVAMVSADIGGGASVTGGIIASFQSDAAAVAGVFIPYVGDLDLVSVLPTFEGTHGTGSELCITLVRMAKENK